MCGARGNGADSSLGDEGLTDSLPEVLHSNTHALALAVGNKVQYKLFSFKMPKFFL